MKNRKIENLAQAAQDDEFKKDAEEAFEKDEINDEFNPRNENYDEEDMQKKKKPVLTEAQLKARKARRTKFAVAAFVLLLGVGVFGNWYYENSDFSAKIKPSITSSNTKTLGEAEYVDASAQGQTESKYFSQARVDRQKSRDEAAETLQAVVDKTDESSEAKQTAAKKLAEISSYIEIENKIETLVAAKGVDNVLAVVSGDGKRVDVIVDAQELSDTLILQIKEIAMQQLGCTFENVSIIQSRSDDGASQSVETTAASSEETTASDGSAKNEETTADEN